MTKSQRTISLHIACSHRSILNELQALGIFGQRLATLDRRGSIELARRLRFCDVLSALAGILAVSLSDAHRQVKSSGEQNESASNPPPPRVAPEPTDVPGRALIVGVVGVPIVGGRDVPIPGGRPPMRGVSIRMPGCVNVLAPGGVSMLVPGSDVPIPGVTGVPIPATVEPPTPGCENDNPGSVDVPIEGSAEPRVVNPPNPRPGGVPSDGNAEPMPFVPNPIPLPSAPPPMPTPSPLFAPVPIPVGLNGSRRVDGTPMPGVGGTVVRESSIPPNTLPGEPPIPDPSGVAPLPSCPYTVTDNAVSTAAAVAAAKRACSLIVPPCRRNEPPPALP
jgi:hypothetical protein